MEIQETALPGDGLRHEFTTSGGRQLGVVSYRTGRREAPTPDFCFQPGDTAVVIGTPGGVKALVGLLG